MLTAEQKLKQLEEATIASQSLLAEKESTLSSATAALDQAKTKLKALSPEAQQTLQVTDTDLPELIGARMRAQEERDEAKARCDTNQKYVSIFRDRIAREKWSVVLREATIHNKS